MALNDELKNVKKDIHTKLKDGYNNAKELKAKGEWKNFKDLESDYYAIVRAIKGGAEDIEDIDIEFRSNVTVSILQKYSGKKAAHSETASFPNSQITKQVFPTELEVLIKEYLTDGIITDKERKVLLRKAEKLGLYVDEVDLYPWEIARAVF